MTQPQKVIGFLDLFGNWDPTLLFVMGGAIGVHFFAYRLVKGGFSPLLSQKLYLPTRVDIDRRLILGSVIFGLGWGLGGYCPGPGIVSLVSLQPSAFVFVAMMCVGMWVQWFVDKQTQSKKP